nr:hypothetical protein [Tanacetum cinerariifolium]
MSYVDACSKEYSRFNILVEDNEDPKYDEDVQNNVESITELEYNIEQVKLTMSNEMDWINLESSNDLETRFYIDFTKPLPLVGPKGNKKISIVNFFNMDLHYLRHEDKEGKCNAGNLPLANLAKEFLQGKNGFSSGEEVYSNFKIMIVKHVMERQLDYGLLTEIKILRADGNKYTFMESDYP